MARGWESKEIEMQIESAQERAATREKARQVTSDQIAFERERESIELSRSRVLGDLSRAANPKYREQLQQSLEFLDAKLSRLLSEAKAKSASTGSS